jgi:hypothetical protein
MQMITDLIDPAEHTGYARDFLSVFAENRFTLRRWFPTNTTDDLEFKIRTGARVDVDAAEFRAFDTPSTMTGRQGITEKRGSIPPLGRAWPVGEEEMIRLRGVQAGSQQPLIDSIYDDTRNAMRSIAARLAYAQGDVLVDGIVTISENGLQLTADFGMPAGHKVTAAIAWTVANAATAVPITNLLAWQETAATDGEALDRMLISRSKLGALQVNAEFRAYASSNGTTPQRVNLDTINGILSSEGLPQVEVYDEKVQIRGVTTRIIPDNYAILLPDPGTRKLGETMYGVTAESVALVEGGYIDARDASGAVAVVMQNAHPMQTFTVGNALALPLLGDPTVHFAANIG